MKNVIVILVAASLAACTAAKPVEAPLPPGHVVLGTFIADVDLQAGTFEIRMAPVAGSLSSTALVDLNADVTVTNQGSAWSNSDQHACTDGSSSPTTWGANVKVKNNSSTTILSGVYAEITNFPVAMTGRESCSSSLAPKGMNANYGVWSYGYLDPLGAAFVDWNFKYTTASKFSFSGRVVGVKIDPADVDNNGPRLVSDTYFNNIAGNGTTILVSSVANKKIDFVDAATGAFQSSVSVGGGSFGAMAIAVSTNRIWYGTVQVNATMALVGWMDRDGGNANQGAINGDFGGSDGIRAIVPDPVDPDNKAWVFYNNGGSDTYVQSFTVSGGSGSGGTPKALGVMAYDAVAGTDSRLYVASFSTNEIIPVSFSTDPASPATPVDVGTPGCAGPYGIGRGLDGKIYFGALGASPSLVCSVTNLGSVAIVGSPGPTAIAYGVTATAAGEVWAVTDVALQRVDDGANAYVAAFPFGNPGTPGMAVVIANGYLWSAGGGSLWRFAIQ